MLLLIFNLLTNIFILQKIAYSARIGRTILLLIYPSIVDIILHLFRRLKLRGGGGGGGGFFIDFSCNDFNLFSRSAFILSSFS